MDIINFMVMTTEQYCDNLAPVIRLAKSAVTLLQWGIPIALVLFGMIDLGKAVIAGKEDEMKKAQGTLIKRFLYAIIIFFVITLVSFAMNLVSGSLEGEEGAAEATSWIQCWNRY